MIQASLRSVLRLRRFLVVHQCPTYSIFELINLLLIVQWDCVNTVTVTFMQLLMHNYLTKEDAKFICTRVVINPSSPSDVPEQSFQMILANPVHGYTLKLYYVLPACYTVKLVNYET